MNPSASASAFSDDDSADAPGACRYFVSYSGVKLPLRLVTPIPEAGLSNRNTFIRAYFAPGEVLTGFDKMVYGEVELSHRYAYHANGRLSRAHVTMDEETVELRFDEDGSPLP